MANLCGFDVIGEISADTLRDMVNQRPLQAGNQSFYLLGGQFLLGLSVTIPNLGTGLVQVVCVVSLDPVVRTPSCRLTVTLSDGSASFGSLGVYHLGGTATLTAAVGFIPDTSTNLPGIQIVPAVLLGSAVATVTLDVTTSSQVDSTFGTGTAANLNLGLKTALETFIQGLGNQAVPAFGFQVVPGRDSSNPAIVTAFPQVMWIDSDTLGIFGFYRGAASGGDLAAKLDSDIVQTTQEFLYNQPGLFSVVEARRIAAVLSPEAFHLVIGCPLIRNAIIKHLLHDVLIGAYQAQVHNAKYNDFYNQEAGAHLLQFINDDLAKNQGESFSDAYQHSVQKIQGIANDDVNGEAEQELNTWLDSPAGQASIADSTPPSCGAGTVQVNRQHMPDPFGDVITMLNSLTVDLAQGHVDIRINAGGDLPVCGSYTVTQGAHLTLGVNVNGAIVPGYSIEIPDVEISTMLVCKLALDLLITFFAGITWGTVIAFGGFALAESIGEGLAAQTIFKKEQAQLPPATTFTPKLPLNAQLKDIVIDPSGITTIALIPRNQHFNDFRPRFEISITQLGRTSRQPDVYGSYHAAATKWGCPSGDFQFTRRFFESSFGVKLNAIDVPMPITVDGWQIEIGNFSYALPGVRDPRPVWSNEPQPIATPEVILTGKTWVPVPPMHGKFQMNQGIQVNVTGSSGAGWQLGFRSQDGAFYAQVSVQATDGDGNSYSASTFFVVTGDEIEFGDDYNQWKQDCDQRYSRWCMLIYASLPPFLSTVPLAPGVTVQNEETVTAILIAQAIQAGDPASYSLLQAATARYGQGIVATIANLPAVAMGTSAQLRIGSTTVAPAIGAALSRNAKLVGSEASKSKPKTKI